MDKKTNLYQKNVPTLFMFSPGKDTRDQWKEGIQVSRMKPG
jgi:hypothetical protein